MADAIPFDQPILVSHHSERRDRSSASPPGRERAMSRRQTDTLIRLVLDFRQRNPWTGLADAPAEVRTALDELAVRTGWRPPPKLRSRKPGPFSKARKGPRSLPVPEWAAALVQRVCQDESRRQPKVTWYQSANFYSSGHTSKAEGPHPRHRRHRPPGR